ncbi:DUF986 family protein, partial [Salmonella enterica subsp. enterica serovar Kentucky]|nr:DUF986 family protein [Salmonella enterica subsp. enterica serovar Kentucky]
MTITDLVLILFIAALLAYALYDQFIMPRRNGPTLLSIALLRRGRATPVAGEIDITSGAIDAIERLLCAHLLPGDSVAVEDPC